MITDERTAAYIDSLQKDNTPFLAELERSAIGEGIPVIRRPAQSLIRFVLADAAPSRILEIGTAVGFSAIFMVTYGPPSLSIDTIENYEKRIAAARKNIASANMENRINLLEGDAVTIIEQLEQSGQIYDMIFIDAAKAQYPIYLPVCKRLLRPGGILISDNVLFDGDIVNSRFAVRRRDRTIHERMRQFLRAVTDDEELTTTILPIGDGMTLSVKRQKGNDG